MTAQEIQPFIEKLTVVGELFDAKLSEAKLTLYFDALQDLPLWVVLDGLDAAVRQCKFMPKPVEIRQLAVGTPEDEAEEAWVRFKDMMRTVGAYRTPRFDAVVALAIADTFGTWPAACAADLSPEMWASKRKEFLRAFVRHQRADAPPACKRLAGVFDLERGLPPVLEDLPPAQLEALQRG